MQDYNWLLTTIAQSSAALVGISSGFLILRISMFYNERRNLLNEINHIKTELEKQLEKYNKLNHLTEELISKNLELKNLFCEKKSELIKSKFPKRIIIAIVGIICLIGFSIIYPVCLIPKESLIYHYTWGFQTIQFLKYTFFLGLGILVFYLIFEIYKYFKSKIPPVELRDEVKEMLIYVRTEIKE